MARGIIRKVSLFSEFGLIFRTHTLGSGTLLSCLKNVRPGFRSYQIRPQFGSLRLLSQSK